MSFNKIAVIAAVLALTSPALAQDRAGTTDSVPTGRSDSMPSGQTKSDARMPAGTKTPATPAGPSSQGSSTPAGPAADTEKK